MSFMAQTKDMLLDIAEAGIRQNGYNAVSFREMADALGIKSASVHYHFKRKEDLGVALVARYTDNFFAAVDTLTSRAEAPRGKIAQFCQAYLSALQTSDAMCLCGMLGAESASLPVSVQLAVNAFFDRNIDWVTNALPENWSLQQRRARAVQIVATLQGSMMLSHARKDQALLVTSISEILSALPE